MLLLHAALVFHAAGRAAFVTESAKAVKEIKEGEFAMTCRGTEGTIECRMLVSERNDACRLSFLKEGKPYFEIAFAKDKGMVVDYEGRSVQKGLDMATLKKQADANQKAEAKAEIPDGNVSVNLDENEGLIVRANPGMENVRRWSADGEELFTGDFGRADKKRGTFQWVRDAKTKMPKSFTGFMDDHPVDIKFVYRPRHVSPNDLRIPASAYAGFKSTNLLPANVKVGG